MQEALSEINWLIEYKSAQPGADKAEIQEAYTKRFRPLRQRSVLERETHAFRFSQSSSGSFSNTVLSISALKRYDQRPFVVVLVRNDDLRFMLANSSLLRKVSHSSRNFTVTQLRGSFNGTDIARAIDGIDNKPTNFESLFALHRDFVWEENVARLVESTNGIVARSVRYAPDALSMDMIESAPERARRAMSSPEWRQQEQRMALRVDEVRDEIFKVARLKNTNLRGNGIEQLITHGTNAHSLGDMDLSLGSGLLSIDIKSRLLNQGASPKAYNIDKMLRFLAQPGSVFAFFFVNIDLRSNEISCRLVPALESSLLRVTRVQHHWCGRGSRGVTQFSHGSGSIDRPGCTPRVDVPQAKAFLQELLDL